MFTGTYDLSSLLVNDEEKEQRVSANQYKRKEEIKSTAKFWLCFACTYTNESYSEHP
jgi:hypothetical protein